MLAPRSHSQRLLRSQQVLRSLGASAAARILIALLGIASFAGGALPRPAIAQTGAPAGQWVSLGPTKILDGWSDASNGDTIGRVTTIAVEPFDAKYIYVGARGSGVWRTENGGLTWSPATDSLPTQDVSAIAIAPSLPSRVYMISPDGTFRSEDRGLTWQQRSGVNINPRGWDGGALRIDPANPDRLYMTTCGIPSITGIHRSLDGGATWQLVRSGGCATSLHLDPANPLVLRASFNPGGSTTGLWESTDGGSSWRSKPGCAGSALPSTAGAEHFRFTQSGRYLYASLKTATTFRVYRNSGKVCGSGATRDYVWTPMWNAPQNAVWNFWSALHANPNHPSYVYASGVWLWVSRDGGATFQQADPQPHADHHGFAADAWDGSVYFGTDGGIFHVDAAVNSTEWKFLGEGIVNAELYDIADAVSEPRTLIGGTQDNGLIAYPGTGTEWRWQWAGDAEMVEIDPTDARVRYVADQNITQLGVTRDSFATWPVPLYPGFAGQYCPPWNTEYPAIPQYQFFIHPTQPNTLLATCAFLWKGNPVPNSWHIPFSSDALTMRTTIDPSADLYWVATSDGKISAGVGAANWYELFVHPLGLTPSDLEVDSAAPSILYAGFLGSGSGRVYRLVRNVSNPTSPSAITARDITANLPVGIKVKTIGISRKSQNTIYVGTDHGVYRGSSSDGGVTFLWLAYKNGLPEAVDVRDLEVHPVTGTMRAATFGRGAWEVQPN